MLTSKQRAELRKMSNPLPSVTQVGKGGVTESLIQGLDKTLENRELIKVTVLETAGVTAREAMQEIAKALNAEEVCDIGFKFVIYRQAKKDPQIKI